MSIENIMPEQDMGGMQEYAGQPAYDGQNNITNVNIIFSKLINVKKTRPSWEYNGYLDGFSQTPKENGNYQNRGYEKRDGFTKCGSYVDDDLTGREITDIATWGGERYFMYINYDGTEKRIYKQCGGNRIIDCDSYLLGCCEGYLSRLNNGILDTPFHTTPCSYNKFVKTFGPKNKTVGTELVCSGTIRAYRIGNTIIHMLYDNVGQQIQVRPGQYVYGYDSTGDALMGWYRSVKGYTTNNGITGLQLNGFVPGLVSDVNGIQDGDFIEQSGLCYKIYDTVGETLSFAADGGAYQIHNADCEGNSDITPYGAMFSSSGYQEDIKSLFTYGGAFGYIGGDIVYISEGGQNPGVFTNIIGQDSVYTDMIEYGNYGYLMGPDSFGILYKLTYQNGTSEYRIASTDKGEGYFNKGSYYGHRGTFYVATHDNEGWATIKSLFLNQQYDKGNGTYSFDIGYSTISNNFIQDHISTANVFHGDKIYFSHDGDELIISITDNRIGELPQYTKLLRYNTLDKDWVVWLICGIHITHHKHGCYYGDSVYTNKGDTDDGHEIKEIIGISFGQINPDQSKLIDSLTLTIGNHTQLGNDSYFLKEVDWQGYRLRKKEKNFFSSEYINNLIEQRNIILSDKYDHIEQGKLFKNMPLGFILNGGNGHTTVEDERTTRKEMDVYCKYNQYHYGVCLEPCQDLQVQEDCCGVVGEQRPNNMYDNDDEHTLVLSRFCTIGHKINNMGNAFYFEYIIGGKDNLQIFKYNIMWKPNNAIEPKAENRLGNSIC